MYFWNVSSDEAFFFAISVDGVKGAEETLQQKGLERRWIPGGTLNCVLQNKIPKLQTQKKNI